MIVSKLDITVTSRRRWSWRLRITIWLSEWVVVSCPSTSSLNSITLSPNICDVKASLIPSRALCRLYHSALRKRTSSGRTVSIAMTVRPQECTTRAATRTFTWSAKEVGNLVELSETWMGRTRAVGSTLKRVHSSRSILRLMRYFHLSQACRVEVSLLTT